MHRMAAGPAAQAAGARPRGRARRGALGRDYVATTACYPLGRPRSTCSDRPSVVESPVVRVALRSARNANREATRAAAGGPEDRMLWGSGDLSVTDQGG